MGEDNETAADNQKRETLSAIPPTSIENQKLSTGKFLLTWEMCIKAMGTPREVPKRKRTWEDSNPVTKRGSRYR